MKYKKKEMLKSKIENCSKNYILRYVLTVCQQLRFTYITEIRIYLTIGLLTRKVNISSLKISYYLWLGSIRE